MNKIIELRFAVLTSLAMLLWLSLEFELGLQDKYISWYPLVTLCSLIVPALCYRQALLERKKIFPMGFTLGRAAFSGFLLSAFTSILSVPVQWFFLKELNPGFIEEIIKYEVSAGKQAPELVAEYINLQSLVIENAAFVFFSGLLITFILALRLRVKSNVR